MKPRWKSDQHGIRVPDLSIPLRMKPVLMKIHWYICICFQFLWGWNTKEIVENSLGSVRLSIPLRMKQISIQNLLFCFVRLSIPLRMKPTDQVRLQWRVRNSFQFLWGWNRCVKCNEDLSRVFYFQFLWGWNREYLTIDSIVSSTFQFLWGWNKTDLNERMEKIDFQFLWGWNKYEKEVEKLIKYLDFQFLWGWNIMMNSA